MAPKIRAVYSGSPASSSPSSNPPLSRASNIAAPSPRSFFELFVIRPLKAADGGRFIEEFDIHGTDSQIDLPFHLEYIPRNTEGSKDGPVKRIWNKIVATLIG